MADKCLYISDFGEGTEQMSSKKSRMQLVRLFQLQTAVVTRARILSLGNPAHRVVTGTHVWDD